MKFLNHSFFCASLRILNRFLILLVFPWMAFAADSVFVPTPPEKPLRFCKSMTLFLKSIQDDSSYVEISKWPEIQLDLRYASFNNVTGHDLYCGSKRAFLHREAAAKLRKAIHILKKTYPDYHWVIFDATRPLFAQEVLRAMVRGTPFSHYVSSPSTGSVHNFGLAVDLSLADSSGTLLDMGTDFDSFESCAGIIGESEALKSGRLNQEQINRRNILRQVMIQAGFISLPSEWWHFNAYPSKVVKAQYSKVSY